MNYYVNYTPTDITIHSGGCHAEVDERHGPFRSGREAISAARALAIRKVSNCEQCDGAEDLNEGCHCELCALTQ